MTLVQRPALPHTDEDAPGVAPAVAAASKESRAVSRARGLGDLMARRPDLLGVYKPADVASEAIRWSV